MLKIMAHEVEQTRKQTNSFMILSKNDFVEFRSSQLGENSKMTLNDSLWPDMISLEATYPPSPACQAAGRPSLRRDLAKRRLSLKVGFVARNPIEQQIDE